MQIWRSRTHCSVKCLFLMFLIWAPWRLNKLKHAAYFILFCILCTTALSKNYVCNWTTQRDVLPQNIQLPHITTLTFYLRLLTPLGLSCSDFQTESLDTFFKNQYVLHPHPLMRVVLQSFLFVKHERRADSPGEKFT